MAEEEILHGGVAHAGAVIRVGDEVLRPASPHRTTINAVLRHVRQAGFDGVPEPLSLAPDGRERLRFIPGDVAYPPFPAWSQTESVLASTALLLRRFHEASVSFVPGDGASWSDELAGPPGDVICHNDVCPENVVFRQGEAVALLDFDFAAPGSRVFDLSSFAIMFIPLDAPEDATRTGRGGLDPFERLRVVVDAYGLAPDRLVPDRRALVDVIATKLAARGAFVRRRVEAGDAAFTRMWDDMGGAPRYERRFRWFEANRARFVDAVA